MNRFADFIIRNRAWLSFAVLAVSILAFFFMPKLRIEEDVDMWFGKNDPILKDYEKFKDLFLDGETSLIVGIPTEDALSGDELSYLDGFSKHLEKKSYVKEILSLTTVDDIRGTEDGLEIKSLLKKIRGERE